MACFQCGRRKDLQQIKKCNQIRVLALSSSKCAQAALDDCFWEHSFWGCEGSLTQEQLDQCVLKAWWEHEDTYSV
jgi:hypothetical protein